VITFAPAKLKYEIISGESIQKGNRVRYKRLEEVL
jgi:hypothetical protein